MLGALEQEVGIIVATVPTLNPLFKTMYDKYTHVCRSYREMPSATPSGAPPPPPRAAKSRLGAHVDGQGRTWSSEGFMLDDLESTAGR